MSSAPTGTRDALDLGHHLHEAAGEGDAAGGDAEHDEALGALVALEDLVRHAAQGPGDVTGAHHHPRGGGGGSSAGSSGEPAVGATESGRVTAPDLLPRLTGRVVKGCRSRARQSLPCGPRAPARWSTGQTRVGLISARRASRPLTKPGRVVGRQRRRERHRLGDGHRVGDVVVVDDLAGADPQDGPVDRGHALDRPALAVVASSSLIAVHLPTTPCTSSTVYSFSGASVAGVGQALGQQRLGVDAALLGLEQDVERPLARLAAGCHQAGTGLVIS